SYLIIARGPRGSFRSFALFASCPSTTVVPMLCSDIRHTLVFLVALAALAAAPASMAQSFPTKPIRLIIPFAPGGSSEIVARAVAQKMGESMGQPVVVEPKPGAAGNIAMQEVAHAAPDGYTLIIGHIGSLAVNPFIFKDLPFDVNRDFTPI